MMSHVCNNSRVLVRVVGRVTERIDLVCGITSYHQGCQLPLQDAMSSSIVHTQSVVCLLSCSISHTHFGISTHHAACTHPCGTYCYPVNFHHLGSSSTSAATGSLCCSGHALAALHLLLSVLGCACQVLCVLCCGRGTLHLSSLALSLTT